MEFKEYYFSLNSIDEGDKNKGFTKIELELSSSGFNLFTERFMDNIVDKSAPRKSNEYWELAVKNTDDIQLICEDDDGNKITSINKYRIVKCIVDNSELDLTLLCKFIMDKLYDEMIEFICDNAEQILKDKQHSIQADKNNVPVYYEYKFGYFSRAQRTNFKLVLYIKIE